MPGNHSILPPVLICLSSSFVSWTMAFYTICCYEWIVYLPHSLWRLNYSGINNLSSITHTYFYSEREWQCSDVRCRAQMLPPHPEFMPPSWNTGRLHGPLCMELSVGTGMIWSRRSERVHKNQGTVSRVLFPAAVSGDTFWYFCPSEAASITQPTHRPLVRSRRWLSSSLRFRRFSL